MNREMSVAANACLAACVESGDRGRGKEDN